MLRNSFLIRIWLVILAVAMLTTACAPSGAVIRVDASSAAFQVNDTVKVPIRAENIANLTALELHLSFDPAVLEVVSVNDGGFLKVNFPVQNTFDNIAGTVDYAVAQIDGMPANGSGTLLEVVFRAKASGQAPVRFRGTQAAPAGILLSDSNGAAIHASFADGSVSVH